jgi:hypothetical protein
MLLSRADRWDMPLIRQYRRWLCDELRRDARSFGSPTVHL